MNNWVPTGYTSTCHKDCISNRTLQRMSGICLISTLFRSIFALVDFERASCNLSCQEINELPKHHMEFTNCIIGWIINSDRKLITNINTSDADVPCFLPTTLVCSNTGPASARLMYV